MLIHTVADVLALVFGHAHPQIHLAVVVCVDWGVTFECICRTVTPSIIYIGSGNGTAVAAC